VSETKTYACSCGASAEGKRCPRGWMASPGGPVCPGCREGMATRVVSLPVRSVVEPAGVSLLDSLRAAWRLSTDLANWCQQELLRRDVRRAPGMERLPPCAVPSLYTIAIRDRGFPVAQLFGGAAGSAAAVVREVERRWRHHPRFGRFAVLWRGESSAATYSYPYPWVVRAQETRLAWPEGGEPELSVTVPGGRQAYRLAGGREFARQHGALRAVLAGAAKLGDTKLCARWSGGRIVGVDAKMSVTTPVAPRSAGPATAIVRTGNDALLVVETPDRDAAWLYHADNLRGVLACYGRWRRRAAVDLKHEKRWPSHTRRRIVAGLQDRIRRHHARLDSGIKQAAAMAVAYCARHRCGSITYDDRERGSVPGDFPWARLRERMSLTAANHGLGFQLLERAEDATE
jgi:hypothetical protein